MTATSSEATATIHARSERQAMDWSLVLTSQRIDVSLEQRTDNGRWQLVVAASDRLRAREVLRQFLRENQGWDWRVQVPGSTVNLHWVAIVWVFLIALLQAAGGPELRRAVYESEAARNGEWWRAFTATWLHADAGHLTMNAVLGGPVLGLAMGRYGAGIAAAGTLAAGAMANGVAASIRQTDYIGLGASGVVMAAIGMLAANMVGLWRHGWRATRWIAPTLLAAAVLFLHVGTSPQSDILVHALGFAFGIPIGILAALWPENHLRWLDRCGWAVAAGITLIPWGRYITL
jgi:membrane associated rhomboid family serine protease